MTPNTDIKVLNQYDEVVSVLSQDSDSKSLPYLKDKVKEKLNDPYSSIEFEAPATHEAAEFLQVENKIAIQNKDNKTLLFRIKNAEDRSDGETKMRWVYAESEALDLLNHWVRPRTFSGMTLQQMTTEILAGSGWQPGNVDWAGSRTHKVDNYKTAIEVFNELRAIFESDLFYRVEITGSRITGRYVDFPERVGEDAGRRFEFEKNMLEITRRESSEDLATALIGVGKSQDGGGYVNFSNVVWSKANGFPVDKPAGQDWVGDPDALQRWGEDGRHVMRTYRNDDQEDPAQLLWQTWKDLQKRKNPAVTFEVKVLLLESLAGYEGDKARLGDTIRPLDHSYNPPILLEARIIEMEWSLSDPEQDSAVLGEYRPRISRNYAIIKDLQNTIQANRGTWDAATRIYSGPTAPENPEDGTFWQDTSTEAPHYIYSWNATAGAWVPTGATQASDLGAVDAATAQTIARDEAEAYAEPVIHEGTTPPADTTRKWLDTSKEPNLLKVYLNGAWVAAAPTQASHVNAEQNIHVGTTAPTDTNRKWLDTSKEPNLLKAYINGAWVAAAPTAPAHVNAEASMHVGTTAPADTTRKWLDTSKSPFIFKTYQNGSWQKATPTTAAEVGAVSTADYTGAKLVAMINAEGNTVKIQGENIELTGAVTVLSDISGNMGNINAGTITLTSTGRKVTIGSGKIVSENTSDLQAPKVEMTQNWLDWYYGGTKQATIGYDGSAGALLVYGNNRMVEIAGSNVTLDNVSQIGGFMGGIAQSTDEWLRLNYSDAVEGVHTNGIYCGSSRLRTDGWLEVGSGGSTAYIGNGQLRYRGDRILFGGAGRALATYTASTRLTANITFSPALIALPRIICTLSWVSGNVSLTKVGMVYAENISASGCTIRVTSAPGYTFVSGDDLYIDYIGVLTD